MGINFEKVFGVLVLSLGLVLAYEALYPYIPGLQSYETTHFWTPYNNEADTSRLNVDTSMSLEGLDSSLLAELDTTTVTTSLSDSLFIYKGDTIFVPDFDNYEGQQHLRSFYKKLVALQEGRRKRVRIAYFGDSTTEGDLIVGDLRDLLQRVFGGRGVGYVSIAPHGTALRRTLRHHYSKNWNNVNYFRKNKNPAFEFALSGDYATPYGRSMDGSHQLIFRPGSGDYPSMNYFEQVYLFYGQARKSDSTRQNPVAHVRINKGEPTDYELVPEKAVNRITLTKSGASRIDISFDFPGPFPIYSLSFESERGILVDNFAKRSDSGSHLGRIDATVMRQFYEYLDCDLVILHYGANVLHNKLDYSYYEPILRTGVRHFQRQMNNVPVLIIGTSDRVRKMNGKEQTNPAVYGLSESQKKVAAMTQNGFLNLFERMGGEGSMLEWEAEDPPLVAPDYVHFNHRGGERIAKIIFEYLMEGYEEHSGKSIENPKRKRLFDYFKPKQE